MKSRATTPSGGKRFTRLITLSALAAIVTGCSGPLSTLSPAGPVAASIAELWWVMLIGAAALLSLVLGLLVIAFFRPGAGERMPPSVWIIGGGLILPAVVLTPLMVYALVTGERILLSRTAAPVQIDVLARQWEWVFTYRAGDTPPRVSRNVLHIQAGAPVQLTITSEDVIHSFWIPRLAGKIDATPGHVTKLRLLADAPGYYRGLCAEYCGTAHWDMQMTVEAHASAEDFDSAVAQLPLDGPERKRP